MSGPLPERPDLGQLRRRAKELRDAARRGDAAALGRFTRHHPSPPSDRVSLAAAQLVIARELSFASWPALKAVIDAGTLCRQAVPAFVAASVEVLAFATVGSGERAGQQGDWTGTVRLLIEAGASRRDVWISGKPPSEEVISLLQGYGIAPDEPAQDHLNDEIELPGSIGTGVMADVARHLEAAYRHRDLDLLGSLLHPQVHWTGVCRNSAEVLDWYRGVLADGTMAVVESVEVDRDAVVLGLSLSLQAEGARPASPQQLYQVFTVDDAQIVDIRGYPDRHSALARQQNLPES